MKKRYIIYFTGLFTEGTLSLSIFKKPKEVRLNSLYEAEAFATKFRYKWMAQCICAMYNFLSEKEIWFKTFKVQEIIAK